MSRVRVLGSLNIDLVQQVPRLPRLGETLTAIHFQTFAGGKGNNQAAASALLGARTEMAGMVGNDPFGARLRSELSALGADVSRVREWAGPSGTATILVMPDGENAIVIAAGANAEVDVSSAVAAVSDLSPGDFLLCQLEIPLVSVGASMSVAKGRGATTILDPAPAQLLSPVMLQTVTILTPNQTEAALLLGHPHPLETVEEAQQAANALRALGPDTVIIKLGTQGCFIANSTHHRHVHGFPVKALDTTAAGDCFNGALAVALSEGASLENAARFANAAAALSVTKPGAVPSMPSRDAVNQFLRAQ